MYSIKNEVSWKNIEIKNIQNSIPSLWSRSKLGIEERRTNRLGSDCGLKKHKYVHIKYVCSTDLKFKKDILLCPKMKLLLVGQF